MTPNLNDFSDTNVTRDENGNAIAYDWQYTAQSGNPGLKPITADQADLTLEYYFGQSSSFTATGFYRSEEHTSELQSLMRISYAVFCLKKKKYTFYKNIIYLSSTLKHIFTHPSTLPI